jgi:hypothetical protein
MIGGIEETSASFEARSAPRSYPTAVQQQLVEIADRPAPGEIEKPTLPTLEQFLAGLRTAWKEGEIRPTSVAKAKPKRLRRRPDPFAVVTTELRQWFEAEPWHTSRELLERLQAHNPASTQTGGCGHCSVV